MTIHIERKGIFIVALIALAICVFGVCLMPCTQVASAAAITDLVNDDMVRFYEDNIAGEVFVSNMSQARRERLRERYGVSDCKLNTILLLQDLGARTGRPQDLDVLAKKKDKQLVSIAKPLIKAYSATLSAEEKAELKNKFKQQMRG